MKQKYRLEDYSFRFRQQKNGNDSNQRVWVVQIINWWSMVGIGKTKEDAYSMLERQFNAFKKDYALPEPSQGFTIENSETKNIEGLKKTAKQFLKRVMNINIADCFISDETNITDFDVDKVEVLKKINKIYKVNFKSLGNGNLVNILKRVKGAKAKHS